MESKTLQGAADAVMRLAHVKHEVSHAKVLVNDLVEDGKRKAQRIARRSMVAAGDCVEDTTYYIKRHPWQSVGIAAGLGATAGLVIALLLTGGRTRH